MEHLNSNNNMIHNKENISDQQRNISHSQSTPTSTNIKSKPNKTNEQQNKKIGLLRFFETVK
jgi:hypothetical protein